MCFVCGYMLDEFSLMFLCCLWNWPFGCCTTA